MTEGLVAETVDIGAVSANDGIGMVKQWRRSFSMDCEFPALSRFMQSGYLFSKPGLTPESGSRWARLPVGLSNNRQERGSWKAPVRSLHVLTTVPKFKCTRFCL